MDVHHTLHFKEIKSEMYWMRKKPKEVQYHACISSIGNRCQFYGKYNLIDSKAARLQVCAALKKKSNLIHSIL